MGQGYIFKCRKCHHEYGVNLGFGFGYPNVYTEKLEAIASGEYGDELKDLFEKTLYAAIDAEEVLYVCNGCGSWKVGTDLTLYAPDDPEALAKKEYGEQTVEEWGYVPYVTKADLREDYHAVKRRYHTCGNCGKRMHKADEKEQQSLRCPKCGTINEAKREFLWD